MLMKRNQSGFTLIELMIVVAIIGILASIAIPAYQDYTIRTRVAETASVVLPIKTNIGLHYSENGSLPANLGSLDYVDSVSTNYAGDYVAKVTVTTGGVINAVLNTNADLPTTLHGKTVVFTPVASSTVINWGVTGSIPDKYLPNK
jgi:type IV pilus assembly protein PilA